MDRGGLRDGLMQGSGLTQLDLLASFSFKAFHKQVEGIALTQVGDTAAESAKVVSVCGHCALTLAQVLQSFSGSRDGVRGSVEGEEGRSELGPRAGKGKAT